ncbi:hypothetical protein ACFY8S_40855 [Streptomyces hygroscopicus]|uniref:hypothetical protein n=1 Tax=Streptomyces hygroscopicus TaxID=1912 RepID=UPI0036C44003
MVRTIVRKKVATGVNGQYIAHHACDQLSPRLRAGRSRRSPRRLRAPSLRTAPSPGQFTVDLPGGGDVIHYPAVLPHADVYSVKVSPYLPDPAGPAVVTAWTMLVSLSTGKPLALLDATELTVERTAATTALTADLLLPPGARTAAVIGYGRIGRAHARYLRHLRPGLTIRAFSPKGVDEADDGVQAAANLEDAVTVQTW